VTTLNTTCCIAGGGPAGVMLGYLLARAGVPVVVLDKHADFFRDFRGDTIHPSTLQVMSELGLLDAFLKIPHQKMERIGGEIGGKRFVFADFSHLPTACQYIAFMPQWDFLDFLTQEGRKFPTFDLRMGADANALIEEGGRVVGLRAAGPQGPLEIYADLVVGADGRHSTIRDRAGFVPEEKSTPIDVLWLRLSRRQDDDRNNTLGQIERGRILVKLDRGDYWQCAYVIPKDSFEALRQRGIGLFRADIAGMATVFADRVGEIKSWDDVKLLTVVVDRLPRWYRPGVLCIGDAAHAMSPIAGVGINLAIQDAVATANILAASLKNKSLSLEDLAAVQARREFPTRATQRMQVLVQNRVMKAVLFGPPKPLNPPWVLNLFNMFPVLRRIPARIVGMGFRPEHVRTKAAF
jgi:2-polyprenyl-6-methoxyphenol hydroxylase-like FAD-dependent oxidoreductase